MPKLIVHPKKTITFRGVEVHGGTAVQATEAEELAFAGKLLTPEEFEAVCIDMKAAADDAREKEGGARQKAIEAQRGGKPEEAAKNPASAPQGFAGDSLEDQE